MEVKEAILQRKSARAFTSQEVKQELLEEILEVAKYSPSSKNNQPWELCIVGNEKKKALDKKILDAFDGGVKGQMEYISETTELKPIYKNRQKELGISLYQLLDIKRDDKEKRISQWRKNFVAFNAPVSMFVFVDKTVGLSAYIDSGIFIQSVALLCEERGLATCIQGSLGQYPQIIKNEFSISDDKTLLCGLAIGYEDKDDIVNTFKSTREDVNEFAKFYM